MESTKTQWIRVFLVFEASTFVVAALVHFGVLVAGYEHRAAGVGETVIAVVLLAGFLATWIRPVWTRVIGLSAQSFALLGTLVGVLTIVVGVGPRTVPDIAYHAGIVVVLAWGLVGTKRALADRVRRSA
jgi:hypothetical protein